MILLVHQNTGKESRYGKNFFAVLISTLGRFDRANKKKSVIYTLMFKMNLPVVDTIYPQSNKFVSRVGTEDQY